MAGMGVCVGCCECVVWECAGFRREKTSRGAKVQLILFRGGN